MSGNRLISTIIFVVAVVAAVIWNIAGNSFTSDKDALQLIPGNAAIVIEIDNPGLLYKKEFNNSSIWNKLSHISVINDLSDFITEADKQLESKTDISELIWNSKVTAAFIGDSSSGVEPVLLLKPSEKISINIIKELLESGLSYNNRVIEVPSVRDAVKIVDTENEGSHFLCAHDGLLIYTQNLEILDQLLNSNNDGLSLASDTLFIKVKQTGGAKAHARLYVNYSQLPNLFKDILKSEWKTEIQWLGNFGGWAELDLLVKNKELIFTGFTSSNSNNYSNLFKDQSPIKIQAYNILPYNTSQLMWLGFSNIQSYFGEAGNNNRLSTLSGKINYDIAKLTASFNGEIVFASNAESTSSLGNGSFAAIGLSNIESAIAAMGRIALNMGNGNTTKYKSNKIGKVNYKQLLSGIFGNSFSLIDENYYTVLSDYLVFANSKNAIQNLIDYYETGKTLDLNDNFKNFSDNLSTRANILIYIKPDVFLNQINRFADNYSARNIELEENIITSIKGFSLQLSTTKDLLFTNAYLNFSDTYHEESLALWKVELNDNISAGPFLVYNHSTRSENIVVFDNSNNMYYLDSDGNILWSKMIDDKPISEIFEIDYFKNGKVQYLFNTGDFFYLIDRTGNYVTGFPKKLHSKATNGLVVYDYLKNKDYRILLAKSDKKIYNYTKAGKEVSGWAQPKMKNIVLSPVNRLVANGKDYIIISDIEDDVKIVNRRGNNRIRLQGDINKAKNSKFYVNKTNSKGIIITTDKEGKLVYISSSGKLSRTDFGTFTPDHYFLYEDFNGDKVMDFIYVDDGVLKVFDRFKKVLFEYSFGSQITISPQVFKLGRNRQLLGVTDENSRTIYLFDEKGNTVISKGLIGETQFTVGDLKHNGKVSLLSAAEKMLYNYRIK